MDNLPTSVTVATIKRARTVAKNALDIGLNPGTVRWIDGKDILFFMFVKNSDLCIIFCAPNCYFIQMHTEDEYGYLHDNYLMIKNIRNWLFHLRKIGYHDCEHILDEEPFDIDFE